jgi:ribosomal protein S18 acetylase RimI-like enzyme
VTSETGAAWPVRIVGPGDRDEIARIADAALDRDPGEGAAVVELLLSRPSGRDGFGLVATIAGRVAGFVVASAHGERGYVDLLAVDAPARRRGVATALFDHLEAALSARGLRPVMIGGNGRRYAWPGIDVEYTGALAFAAARGYRRIDDAQNMIVDLRSWAPGTTGDVLRRHGALDVSVRRAAVDEWPLLGDFVAREFTTGWRDEVALAVHRLVPTAFVARRNDEIVGFACHGVHRAAWFGPIGTAPAERGNGIGEALLRSCLDDLARTGTVRADIAWVGPTAFYVRTVGARAGRQFAILAKGEER